MRESEREGGRGGKEGGARRVEMSSNTHSLSLHFIISVLSLFCTTLVRSSLSVPPSAPTSVGVGRGGDAWGEVEGGS